MCETETETDYLVAETRVNRNQLMSLHIKQSIYFLSVFTKASHRRERNSKWVAGLRVFEDLKPSAERCTKVLTEAQTFSVQK